MWASIGCRVYGYTAAYLWAPTGWQLNTVTRARLQIAALRMDVQRLTTGKRAAESQVADLKKQLAAAYAGGGDASGAAPVIVAVPPQELPQWPEAMRTPVPTTVTPSQPEPLFSAAVRVPPLEAPAAAPAPSATPEPAMPAAEPAANAAQGVCAQQQAQTVELAAAEALSQQQQQPPVASPTAAPASTPQLNGCGSQVSPREPLVSAIPLRCRFKSFRA